MRIAALADVHGNLPALEAVLAELEREGVDEVVSCGDVAGPFGDECVAALEQVGARFLRGNADERPDWPLTVRIGHVLFCHGTPRSDTEVVTRITPGNEVAEALAGVDAHLVVCGHTHVQYDRRVGGIRLVNAGSVGRPYERRAAAFWALVEGGDVALRRTEYDVPGAAAAIRAKGGAEADELAGSLLDPAGPEEATAFFEGLRGA